MTLLMCERIPWHLEKRPLAWLRKQAREDSVARNDGTTGHDKWTRQQCVDYLSGQDKLRQI